MQYIKTKNLTQKKQVLCGLRGIFLLFSCQTPVMPDGKAGMPCGACRELMMQLDERAGETEILCDYETKKTVRLKSLIPDWWGPHS